MNATEPVANRPARYTRSHGIAPGDYRDRYDARLRRLGYRVRRAPQWPLLAMLDRAGCGMRPLNRRDSSHGTWAGRCPWCRREDAIYAEPGLTEWMVTCGCATGGTIWELHAALLAVMR